MTALDVRQIVEKELDKGRFPAVKHELRIVINEKAFDRAVTRGDADTTREIGGVLVGELLRDEAGPFLRVDATIDALHAEEKGAELTFTHATWEHIHKEMDASHAGKKIVGWYHTHPGFGIFLSDRDQFIHSSFFNLPFQIALVYDPKSKEHGVFAWRDGQPARSRRYWVGEREHTWDGVRTASTGVKERDRDEGSTPKSARGSASSSGQTAGTRRAAETKGDSKSEDRDAEGPLDWKSAATIGVIMAIVGVAGGYFFGTREARTVLHELPVALQQAREEAVRGAMNELDGRLVGLLRNTVGNEAVRKPLDQVVNELDEAEQSITTEPGPYNAGHETALGKIRSARDKAQRIKDDRGDAQAALTQLEEISKHRALDPADVSRDLGTMRSALGALYAELATDGAKGGDARRADRLLAAAAAVDPGNRARYEQLLKSLQQGGGPREAPGGSGAPAATQEPRKAGQ